jgi:hypothetical protein
MPMRVPVGDGADDEDQDAGERDAGADAAECPAAKARVRGVPAQARDRLDEQLRRGDAGDEPQGIPEGQLVGERHEREDRDGGHQGGTQRPAGGDESRDEDREDSADEAAGIARCGQAPAPAPEVLSPACAVTSGRIGVHTKRPRPVTATMTATACRTISQGRAVVKIEQYNGDHGTILPNVLGLHGRRSLDSCGGRNTD